MRKLCCLILFIAIAFSATADTFHKYSGETQKDIAYAKKIYNTFNKYGVLAVEVSEMMMFVHITETLYREFLYDKVTGKQIIRGWARGLQQSTGEKVVDITVLFDNTTVITAGYSLWKGEIIVKYHE